jgi:hypothetical protein
MTQSLEVVVVCLDFISIMRIVVCYQITVLVITKAYGILGVKKLLLAVRHMPVKTGNG